MTSLRSCFGPILGLLFWGGLGLGIGLSSAPTVALAADDDAIVAELKAGGEKLVAAFNAGKATETAAFFLPKGEWIDEEGTVYQGKEQIEEVLKAYFEKFPGAKMGLEVESVRVVGPVAIEEGSRTMTGGKAGGEAIIRYIAVYAKSDAGWRIASVRDFADDPAPTAHDHLAPLSWLVGDWVNEGSGMVVKISYKWSEDTNFLLGDYNITSGETVVMKSTQRIGWDPLTGKVKSWMFDADGGYATAEWTQLEEGWVLKSSAVLPDGQTGSATIAVTASDAARFNMKGTERIVGDTRDDDFDITVVRQAPAAGAKDGKAAPGTAAPAAGK